MQHVLTRLVFEERAELPLTEQQYAEARAAMRHVLGALSVEEKFNLVLENFEEFERELLAGALGRSLFRREDWSEQMTELHRVNRRLVNLLATTRLYVDQVPHDLRNMYGPGARHVELFTAFKAREYMKRLGYRVMEALRNYMQHRSLPIHALVHDQRLRDRPGRPLMEHTLTPELDPEALREDGKFKAGVLAELEPLGDRVPIPPLVREYISGLAAVHRDVRALLEPDVA